MLKQILVAAALTLGASKAAAGEVNALARQYTHSCGYFSSRVADIKLNYENTSLEWGVQLQLIYGFEGEDVTGGGNSVNRRRIEWQQEQRRNLDSSGAYQWSTEFQVPVHYRSSSRFYDKVDLVVRIVHPDGRVEYDNGTSTAWGFYQVEIPYSSRCVGSGNDLPNFEEATVSTVWRD